MTSLRATTIPSHSIQTLSGSPEVNGGWERNSILEENHGPDGNFGQKPNHESCQIKAELLGLQPSKCPASIQPRPNFVNRWFLFYFFLFFTKLICLLLSIVSEYNDIN